MAQKECDLDTLVKRELSKLSFYSKHDSIELTKDENENYLLEYYAKKAKTPEYKSYFKCSVDLNFKQKSATWIYVWLDEKYRGKGWGGELVKKGEDLFKKLDLSIAYVHSNMNPDFWTSVGYPTCLKQIKKSDEKSVYHHTYGLLKEIGVKNKKAKVWITELDDNTFEINYECIEKNYDLNFEMKIDTKEKTATWVRMDAEKPDKLISKSEKMLKSLGIKEARVNIYYFNEKESVWSEAGYKKDDNGWYKVLS